MRVKERLFPGCLGRSPSDGCASRITKADFSAPASRSVEMTVVVWGGWGSSSRPERRLYRRVAERSAFASWRDQFCALCPPHPFRDRLRKEWGTGLGLLRETVLCSARCGGAMVSFQRSQYFLFRRQGVRTDEVSTG